MYKLIFLFLSIRLVLGYSDCIRKNDYQYLFFKTCCAGSIVISHTVKNIEKDAFKDCELTSVTIPSSVTSIGNFAFYNNTPSLCFIYLGVDPDIRSICRPACPTIAPSPSSFEESNKVNADTTKASAKETQEQDNMSNYTPSANHCDIVWDLITNPRNAVSSTSTSTAAKLKLEELGLSTPDHLQYMDKKEVESILLLLNPMAARILKKKSNGR